MRSHAVVSKQGNLGKNSYIVQRVLVVPAKDRKLQLLQLPRNVQPIVFKDSQYKTVDKWEQQRKQQQGGSRVGNASRRDRFSTPQRQSLGQIRNAVPKSAESTANKRPVERLAEDSQRVDGRGENAPELDFISSKIARERAQKKQQEGKEESPEFMFLSRKITRERQSQRQQRQSLPPPAIQQRAPSQTSHLTADSSKKLITIQTFPRISPQIIALDIS